MTSTGKPIPPTITSLPTWEGCLKIIPQQERINKKIYKYMKYQQQNNGIGRDYISLQETFL